MEKRYLNWSTGKDACLALHKLNTVNKPVEKLLTTFNAETKRVSMHGVSVDLLRAQAKALGIPLEEIALSGEVSLETYNKKMQEYAEKLKSEGFTTAVFGDIFLEDLRAYRETQLQKVSLAADFPLWNTVPKALLTDFFRLGYKAVIVAVNASVLDKSYCGKELTPELIDSFPDGVDICGENGEYHTFVYDGPMFKTPVDFIIGETVKHAYKPVTNKNEGDCFKNCFKEEELTWDTSFWFTNLQLK